MPNNLLSDEELLALEEELAARESQSVPQDEPPAGMIDYVPKSSFPSVLPPGPSPVFLQRQMMSEKLPPGTGMFSGPQGTFYAVGPPPPSQEMQMMEQLRGQINAMEFKNANDALNAAIQFQHMREAQRLRSSGTPEEQILQRLGRGLFYQQPNVLPSMMRETRPVPAPSQVPGRPDLWRIGRYGERMFQERAAPPPTPTQVQQIPVLKPDGTVDPDSYAVPSAGGRGVTVHRRAKEASEKTLTPNAQVTIWRDQIKDAEEQIRQLPISLMQEPFGLPINKGVKEKRAELETFIKRKKAQIDAMGEPKGSTVAPTDAPITAPATPTSKAEYDSLPSGSYYVDPTSKATKRKK